MEYLIKETAHIESVSWLTQEKEAAWVSGISGEIAFFMPASRSAKEAQNQRLKKQEDQLKKDIESLSKKLNNHHFLQKAPEAVVVGIKQKHNQALASLKTLQEKLS